MKLKFLYSIAASLCAVSYAGAQGQPSQAETKAFVTEYVAAYNAKDEAHLLALYEPASRACVLGEDKDYRDATMAMMWETPMPAKYTFTVSPVNESNLKGIETFGRFPQKPQRELHIDYQQGDDGGTTIVYLVQENGHWLADQPCASQQTMKQFRDEAPARKAAEGHYKSLADTIQEPLRSQLVALLRDHKTAEAIDRYKDASGQDVHVAMFVMHQLALEIMQ